MSGNVKTEQQEMSDVLTEVLLTSLLTVSEVCKMWGKSRTTVEMRVWKSHFSARKTGNGWLISKESVLSVWGEPEKQLGEIYDDNTIII